MTSCTSRFRTLSTVAFAIGLALGAPAFAGPVSFNADTIYRLDQTATYQAGCFEPCLCPIEEPMMTRGTLVLGPVTPGDAVDFREVKDINWRVGNDVIPQHSITGSGIYRRTNFGDPVLHALDLDLSIDGGPVQHFFSDFVPANNGNSLGIQISINGVFCNDIVIQVDGSVVPKDQIKRYTLIDGSTYQEGCFVPCDCPLQEPRAMQGSFALVPVLEYGTYVEYAIVSAAFAVPAPSNLDPAVMIEGNGFYTLIQGFAGPMQSMDLWLSLNGDPPTNFNSGPIYQNIPPIFPGIDVVVNMNGLVCYDIVLTMKARPVQLGALGGWIPALSGSN